MAIDQSQKTLLTAKIEIPMQNLCLDTFHGAPLDSYIDYNLCATTNHIGSTLHQGHYTASAKYSGNGIHLMMHKLTYCLVEEIY